MTIFLTGSNGFIGHHFLKALLLQGHTVIAPVRSASASVLKQGRLPGLVVVEGFFGDADFLAGIKQPVDAVVHLAAIRGAGGAKAADYQKVNVDATRTLLAWAVEHHLSRFVYCSTVGVLGTIPAHLPASVKDEARPDGPYHQSKYQAEMLVRRAHSAQLKTLVLRPTITYGAGDNGFLPRLIHMVKKRMIILPHPDIRLHLLSVTHFAGLAAMILKTDRGWGQVYHVADREAVSLKKLVDFISQILTKKPYPRLWQSPAWLYHTAAGMLEMAGRAGLKTSIELISRDWYYDISETTEQLNFNPADTFEEVGEMLK